MPPMKMVHTQDPVDVIRKNIGSLDGFIVTGDQVLLGIYQRPEKTASGIIITDKTRGEDEHQGKAGLVLKLGEKAFKYDGEFAYEGPVFKEGDWVATWVTDGRKLYVNSQLCRLVRSEQIRLGIPHPDSVY